MYKLLLMLHGRWVGVMIGSRPRKACGGIHGVISVSCREGGVAYGCSRGGIVWNANGGMVNLGVPHGGLL